MVVATLGGSATASNPFTYYGVPTATGVTPAAGPLVGGTAVTIAGTNFGTGVTTVTIGGAPITGLTVTSSTTLTGTAPAGAPGPRRSS